MSQTRLAGTRHDAPAAAGKSLLRRWWERWVALHDFDVADLPESCMDYALGPASYLAARILSELRAPASDPLEVADPLPVGDGAAERVVLRPEEVDVVFDDVRAERAAGELAPGQPIDGLGQCRRHPRELGCGVRIPDELWRRVDAPLDAVEPGRDGRGER